MSNLSENLHRLRTERGLSRSELERLSGVSWPTIYDLEHGSRNPRLDTLQALAETLGVGLDELCYGPVVRFRGFCSCDGDEEITLSDGSTVKGRWVFGDLLCNDTDCCIVERFRMVPVQALRDGKFADTYMVEIEGEKVIPETVGKVWESPSHENPSHEEESQ